ncbi:Flp family type IVb pilin [Devosia faecipullorum]|uniref:Flp family type IVb pilin n=1 Tax=Devosia faecipullorum TaxID=2755039 RepID=UPI002EDA3B1A
MSNTIKNFAKNKTFFISFFQDERGATAIEYALIASLVSLAIVSSALVVGDNLFNMWEYVRSHVVDALAG